ncbi:hypothetical protein F2Q70_00018192 [Brassica cretica]|uniref:Uncharacterized protein n=1 Tax=Brassica cretica TaxID=69181 RepID=A0A8S9I6T8_BRACR|nr:hypothetical protein F2Q70_00018192 [Brassica cretica]
MNFNCEQRQLWYCERKLKLLVPTAPALVLFHALATKRKVEHLSLQELLREGPKGSWMDEKAMAWFD